MNISRGIPLMVYKKMYEATSLTMTSANTQKQNQQGRAVAVMKLWNTYWSAKLLRPP
jgi:hypothetical protein